MIGRDLPPAEFSPAGLIQDDRVALVYPTCAGFFDAFFGVLLAGAVPVPLYPPVRLGRLDEYHERTAAMLRAVDARLVLAERRVRRLLGPAIEAAQPALGCRTLDELPRAQPKSMPVGEGDLALVQFSSGTTVDPKPVALSHRAVVAQTMCLNGFWPDGNGIVHSGASWLPLYHDMGLIGCVFPALERGAVLTLIPPELFVARPAVWLAHHLALPGHRLSGAQFRLRAVRRSHPRRRAGGRRPVVLAGGSQRR